MIPFATMLRTGEGWFDGSGPRGEEILSTRVRLARNLAGYRFVGRAQEEELDAIYQRVAQAARGTAHLQGVEPTAISELGVLDRHFLLERHLISHDMTAEGRHRGVLIAAAESPSLMINEEDHLRIQALSSGMQLSKTWEDASAVEDELARQVPFAFHEEFGYLTACPTNAGTGMRASVLIHLPALVLMGRIKKVLSGVTQVGLAVRGFYGEGSEVVGNFFQISNQITLGISETATLDKLQEVVLQVLDLEAKARDALLRDARIQIEDKIGRALGTLGNARLLSTSECIGLLSAVRFGHTIGLPSLPPLPVLNELLLLTQPAHLQKLAGREMTSAERNEHRARWVRERLQNPGAPKPAPES